MACPTNKHFAYTKPQGTKRLVICAIAQLPQAAHSGYVTGRYAIVRATTIWM